MPATKNTPSTHHPRRRNVTTLMVGLKNGHIRKNLTQSGEPQRYSWGTKKKKMLSASVISRSPQRFLATEQAGERPWSGRLQKTTGREGRHVTRRVLAVRSSTAKCIRQLWTATRTNIAWQTVRKRLHAAQFHCPSVECTRVTSSQRCSLRLVHTLSIGSCPD